MSMEVLLVVRRCVSLELNLKVFRRRVKAFKAASISFEHRHPMSNLITLVKGEPTLVYESLAHAIEDRIGKNLRDFNGSFRHFDQWCDARKYKKRDPEGKPRNLSTIWPLEYRDAEDGEVMRPLHQDFWHVWIAYTAFRGFGGSKKLTLTKVHDKIRAATGNPRKGLRDTYQLIKEKIDRFEADDKRKASMQLQYLRSFQESYELEWTEEIFSAIYDLLGDYKDQPIRVKY